MAKPENDIDVCILGAGPHGLAAAVHLRQADPDLSITVLDPSGSWLGGWTKQFAQAEIKMLRSPVVHHPAPDPYALSDFIDEHDLPRSGFRYDLPMQAVFARFCQSLIDEAALEAPVASTVRAIHSRGDHLAIEASDMAFTTRHLVVATNPHRRKLPDWVWSLGGKQPGLLAHGADVNLPSLPCLDGQRIAIIGGGLTAAHLALGAALRGGNVELLIRHELNISAFDVAPGWLGPKYLDAFDAEANPARRLAIAQRVVAGGSVPEWMHTRLIDFAGPGTLNVREAAEVGFCEALPHGGCHLFLQNGDGVSADRVWLATGTDPDASALRCLRPLLADVGDVNGFPLLDEHLRLGHQPIFMMGRTAMMSLGPAAGNLWGAQRAASRITEAVTGTAPARRNAAWIHAPNGHN